LIHDARSKERQEMAVKRIQARKRRTITAARLDPVAVGRGTGASTARGAELLGRSDVTLGRIDRLLGRVDRHDAVTRA
jgi:hypothetical protein